MDFPTFAQILSMENEQPSRPGIEKIVREAFGYWFSTIRYQIFFSVIYFFFLFMVAQFFMRDAGIFNDYAALVSNKTATPAEIRMEAQKIIANPALARLSWVMLGTLVFLFPLNIGFFKIYRKMDLGEKPEARDLFAGYSGVNFLIFTSYYLFWFMVFSYALPTVFLGILWIFATLFTTPLMFFAGKRSLETIGLNFRALRNFFPEIIAGVFVAVLVRYAGLLLFGVGFLFTFPFYNAMIYALYKNVFSEKY